MSTLYVNTLTPNSGNTVSVSGSLYVSGNITLGDENTDGIAFGAEISSSITPDSASTYNLGSSSRQWNNVYANNFIGTATTSSYALSSTSASYALTASHANTVASVQTNLTTLGVLTGLTVQNSASFIRPNNSGDIVTNGTISASGAITASGFLGMASNALNAATASFVLTAISSSYAVSSTSASYALTASHAIAATTSENLGTDLTPTLETKTSGFTAVAGREYIVNSSTGIAVVLPSAVAGARITIILQDKITIGNMTITAAAGDLLKGYAFLEATDAANNKSFFAPDGSDDLIITLNGSTKGGLVGDRIELVGISGTEWRVRATLSHTGTAAIPFS